MIESVVLTEQDDGSVVVEMTVDGRMMWDIRGLRYLLRDEVPDGDLGKILHLALGALAQDLKRKTGSANP